MKALLRYSVLVLTVWLTSLSYGQQDPMYSQYMFNGLLINPAYASTGEDYTFSFLGRNQYRGLEFSTQNKGTAPMTYAATGTMQFKDDVNSTGLMLMKDQLGVTDKTSAMLVFGHKVIFKKSVLILGGQAGVNRYRYNFSDIYLKDAADVLFPKDAINITTPNFGMGALYYRDNFYFGVSVPHFVNNALSADYGNGKEQRHYFGQAGVEFDLTEKVKFKPNVLAKYVNGAPLQFDVNGNVSYNESIWAGVSYRSRESIDFMVEFKTFDILRVGYSYDLPIGRVKVFGLGSHELSLNFHFKLKEHIEVIDSEDPRNF